MRFLICWVIALAPPNGCCTPLQTKNNGFFLRESCAIHWSCDDDTSISKIMHNFKDYPSHRVSKRKDEYVPSVSHKLPLMNKCLMFFLNLSEWSRNNHCQLLHLIRIKPGNLSTANWRSVGLKSLESATLVMRNASSWASARAARVLVASKCGNIDPLDFAKQQFLQPSHKASSTVQFWRNSAALIPSA